MADYNAPDISTLSAHEYNKIRTSLDKYYATQTQPARGFNTRMESSAFFRKGRKAKKAREDFKSGKDYGIEDEYRYMLSQGFRPQAAAPVAPAVTEHQDVKSQPPITQPGFSATPLPTDFDQAPAAAPAQPQGPSAADVLAGQIQAMQQMFAQSMQQQQMQYQQMQAAQQQRMQELQQQMIASQMAQQQRPVAGVRMADGMSGTPMQIARRGTSGAFGRRGMRIKGLNIK